MSQSSNFFFLSFFEEENFPMLTAKEVFVDLLAVSFGNKPAAVMVSFASSIYDVELKRT